MTERGESANPKEVLTSEEKGIIAFALGALTGDYIQRAKDGKISWDDAHKAERTNCDLCHKVSQL